MVQTWPIDAATTIEVKFKHYCNVTYCKQDSISAHRAEYVTHNTTQSHDVIIKIRKAEHHNHPDMNVT